MKFELTLKHDPRGAHVVFAHESTLLLGEVRDCLEGFWLVVHHFNGEPWPISRIDPTLVDVLERTYELEAS